MSLIQWRPFGWAMRDPFEEMEHMISDFPSMAPGRMSVFAPAVDMYEKDGNVVVEMPLAGVDPEKVEITIEDNTLTVKGGSESKTEVDEKNYYRKEVRGGSFYRAVSLPAPVLKDKASASSENGILKITLPKAPEVKTKTVPVKVKVASKKK